MSRSKSKSDGDLIFIPSAANLVFQGFAGNRGFGAKRQESMGRLTSASTTGLFSFALRAWRSGTHTNVLEHSGAAVPWGTGCSEEGRVHPDRPGEASPPN